MTDIYTLIILNISLFFAMSYITEEKLNFQDKRIYIIYFLCTFITIMNTLFTIESLRVVINAIIFILTVKQLFRKNIKDSIILGICLFVLAALSEMLYGLISYPILSNININNNNIVLDIFNNLMVAIVFIFLSKRVYIKKICISLVEGTDKIKNRQVVLFSLFVVATFNIISLIFYYNSNGESSFNYLVLISSALTIVNGIIVYSYLKSNNKYLKVYEKYNISLESVREYENILEKYKINNHENKNQFMIIRNMSKNKKIIKYIDGLIDNNIKDDEQLFIDISKIPEGGLKGLIYSKLLIMKTKDIQFELHIDRKISTGKVIKIEDSFIIDICKIVGVFLDNAIEAVENQKEKYIIIELYTDKKEIIISITNNYIGCIKLDKLSNPGYTTKENGHGYGLTLVNELVNKNNKLENFKEVYDDNFTQILRIKL